MNIFNTDYYQFTMSLAYLLCGKANETTGFESFVRNIKKEIDPSQQAYIFSGEKEVVSFLETVKTEIQSENFFELFWTIVSKSISKEKQHQIYEKAKEAFDSVDKNFEYTVLKEGSIVKPYVPVFQYKGPKIFGQMIETKITNIINGRTGLKSYKAKNKALEEIVNDRNTNAYNDYLERIEKRAVQYRRATSKILLEAGYRRSPSQGIADEASRIAMEQNWDGTSNVSAYQKGLVDKIGGTMAHSFIMSFESELEAFKTWNEIFTGSTILIDTYDTINAVKTLIKHNIRPSSVRIDSGDLKALSFKVRDILDNAGWTEVQIFISGDMTPELLAEFEKENVPFDITMAGTKYVNIDEAVHVNAGFVYKIVEYEKNGKKFYPVKKASGKSNYPGLKKVEFKKDKIIVSVGDNWGFFGNSSNVNAKALFNIKV